MSNQLKLANQVVLLNGNPITLATRTADPVSGSVVGDMYYNTTSSAVRTFDGSVWSSEGSGTVTSVAVSVPSFLAVSGSPITSSGTIAITLQTETANTVFAGPTSGGAATPTFRSLVAADIPAISLTTGVTGILPIANGGTNASTKSGAFDSLSPMTTLGDIIIGGASGTGTRLGIGTTGQLLTVVGGSPAWASPATSGTVTSVAVTVPSFLSVSGSPITTSGTIAITLATETANTIFAGPASGGAATPTFRALVAADIPSLPYATTALDNLASVAINTALLPGTTATIDLGSTSKTWVNGWMANVKSSAGDLTLTTTATNGNVATIANGTGNIVQQATIIQTSQSAASTNYKEVQYFDAVTLAANTSSFTTLSSLTFSSVNFRGAILDYTIRETTSDKQRTGRLLVASDGTNATSSDQYSETAVLGTGTGLALQATQNVNSVFIQFNNTDATNACTMRVEITRLRA